MSGCRFAEAVEAEPCRNYHHAQARNLGQLRAVRPVLVRDGAATCLSERLAHGARAGTVKIPALLVR